MSALYAGVVYDGAGRCVNEDPLAQVSANSPILRDLTTAISHDPNSDGNLQFCQLDRLDINPHVSTARQEISLSTTTPAPKTQPKTQPHDATPQSDRSGSALNPMMTTHRSRATPHPSQPAPTDSRTTTRRFSAFWHASYAHLTPGCCLSSSPVPPRRAAVAG
jgi:hypothetical protein